MPVQPIAPPISNQPGSLASGTKPGPRNTLPLNESTESGKPRGTENNTQNADKPDQRVIKESLLKANEVTSALRSNLQFTTDEETGIHIVKVIDIQTEEVIRQIPSEEMVAIAKRLDELKGLFIKEKA